MRQSRHNITGSLRRFTTPRDDFYWRYSHVGSFHTRKQVTMLRKTLLILSACVMMHSAAYADEHAYQEVTAEQLQQLKQTLPSLKIIDSRGEDQIKDGMIQGAINLPVYDTDAQQLASIAQDKTTPLAFYCNDKYCSASAIAANKAAKAGYTKLYKYTGGIAEWKAKKLPVQ